MVALNRQISYLACLDTSPGISSLNPFIETVILIVLSSTRICLSYSILSKALWVLLLFSNVDGALIEVQTFFLTCTNPIFSSVRSLQGPMTSDRCVTQCQFGEVDLVRRSDFHGYEVPAIIRNFLTTNRTCRLQACMWLLYVAYVSFPRLVDTYCDAG
jgi:hypothetical protein